MWKTRQKNPEICEDWIHPVLDLEILISAKIFDNLFTMVFGKEPDKNTKILQCVVISNLKKSMFNE